MITLPEKMHRTPVASKFLIHRNQEPWGLNSQTVLKHFLARKLTTRISYNPYNQFWTIDVIGEHDLTFFDTDYENYAAFFTCQSVVVGHRRSASIISRTPLLASRLIAKVINQLIKIFFAIFTRLGLIFLNDIGKGKTHEFRYWFGSLETDWPTSLQLFANYYGDIHFQLLVHSDLWLQPITWMLLLCCFIIWIWNDFHYELLSDFKSQIKFKCLFGLHFTDYNGFFVVQFVALIFLGRLYGILHTSWIKYR